MNAECFVLWLKAMKDAGSIRFDNDAAEMLGITDDTIIKYKAKGTDKKTALACAALLARLGPYCCR
jgi:hypothetical protein